MQRLLREPAHEDSYHHVLCGSLFAIKLLYDKNPNSTLKQLLAKLEQHRAGDITHIFLKVSKKTPIFVHS